MKEKILVSDCLFGRKVRYDGKDAACMDPRFIKWKEEGGLVGICPEVEGGLAITREPCERLRGSIISQSGCDFTAQYEIGAEKALLFAKKKKVVMAILKQNSPSCGSLYIYDGTFRGIKKPGQGVTAELLRKNGIKVFGEDQLDEAEREIKKISSSS